MDNYYGWWLPKDISTHGAPIDQLIFIFHILMAVLFVGWLIFLIFTLVKFRARPGHKATYKMGHFKAPTYIEIAVALVEAVLLVGFSLPIMNSYRHEPPAADKAFEVRVIAEQFAWTVHYPGADKKFGRTKASLMGPGNSAGLDKTDPAAQDDVVAVNQLRVPVNTPVIAHLSSKDVIHSFFIPVMRVKQDTIPGQEIPVWFEATEAGKFEIACAQLCGLGHYRMRGFFNVETQEDLDKWLEEKSK